MAYNVRIKAKNSTGYTEIAPKSVLASGEDRINGQVYGVYSYTLTPSAWAQSAFHNITFTNEDVLSTDNPYVVPVLTSTVEQMEWSKVSGVFTYNGSIMFHADEAPQVTLNAIVWWVR